MKLAVTSFALICFINLSSQVAIPNAGFESWTTVQLWEAPVNYFTSNSSAYFNYDALNVFKSASAHSGDYAVLLEAGSPNLEVSSSISIGGSIFETVESAYPFAGRPVAIEFWSSYSLQSPDIYFATATFYSEGVEVGSADINLSGESDGYELITMNVNYISEAIPDAISMSIYLSNTNNLEPASTVLIDDLHAIYDGTEGDGFPNGSFENWITFSDFHPDNWYTTNLFNLLAYPVTQSMDAHQGNYAVAIEFLQDSSFGAVYLGDKDFDCDEHHFPVGDTEIPITLSGYYKFTAADPNENATAFLTYADADCDILYELSYELPPASEWTEFSVPVPEVVYNEWGVSENMPAFLTIAFSPYAVENGNGMGTPGNLLLVDDLSLENITIDNVIEFSNSFRVYPNPARDQFSLVSDIPANIQSIKIFDLQGRQLSVEKAINAGAIDISTLAAGTYLCRVLTDEGEYSVMFIHE